MTDLAIIWDWVAFSVRWLHVVTAIAWIGSSFYFVALDLGLKKVWLQLGVASAEALEIAEKRELEIVEEQCLMVVHSLYSPH